jgi:hypothetical protein
MSTKSTQCGFITLLKNLGRLTKYDYKWINKRELYAQLNELQRSNFFNYVHTHTEFRDNFKLELSNLTNEELNIFPYKQLKELSNTEYGYDKQLKLPYVVHDKKRLYFPKTWTAEDSFNSYKNFIENENILGGKYKEKAPHQYETNTFCVKDGDVVLDVGCAEGLFALNVIDKAKKIYLIESDKLWLDALKETFKPYKDKVVFINKLISDKNTKHTITLSSILEKELSSFFFVKMDIEGYETEVINSSKDILAKDIDIRLACCTYHKQNDAEELQKTFTKLNYDTEFSDGYMLPISSASLFDIIQPPYFRKGVIRARKDGSVN